MAVTKHLQVPTGPDISNKKLNRSPTSSREPNSQLPSAGGACRALGSLGRAWLWSLLYGLHHNTHYWQKSCCCQLSSIQLLHRASQCCGGSGSRGDHCALFACSSSAGLTMGSSEWGRCCLSKFTTAAKCSVTGRSFGCWCTGLSMVEEHFSWQAGGRKTYRI